MERTKPTIGILHYTASPVVGGVEAVIDAQTQLLSRAGYPLRVITGRGNANAFPASTRLVTIPEMDTQHAHWLPLHQALENGARSPEIQNRFEEAVEHLQKALAKHVSTCDTLIIHNVFTKHFNLPLTAALHRLIDNGLIRHSVAWCHDFSWTSPNSRSKVYPAYPWDLLRNGRQDTHYVVVSQQRQAELAGLFGWELERIQVIYNGVDPAELLGLTPQGMELAQRLNLLGSDLSLIMPVRITKAKNFEYALRLVAAIKRRGCKVKLVITGPPDPHDPENLKYYSTLLELRSELELVEEVRFVYESGPVPGQPYQISSRQVGELYRLCDMLLMPSHREGFAMPVLEAGLAGLPVVSTDVPAAREIGAEDVFIFNALEMPPDDLAQYLLQRSQHDPLLRLRRRVRQNYTWDTIFARHIEPLLRN
ncbi:MAG: glycosyltransferase family 4 protein [Chloroflexota bacterium]